MASIKLKFRTSRGDCSEGTICFRISHNRTSRLLATSYSLRAEEWDESKSNVSVTKKSQRHDLIVAVRESIKRDMERLSRIVMQLDACGYEYTADDIIDEFRRYLRQYSTFNYMETIIVRLSGSGRHRTSETYRAALNSFRKFRNGDDIMLDCITAEIMEDYEAWHRRKGNCPNTVSFYARILRAVYNRAVDDNIIDNRFPFRHIYTGVDKTVKRALPLSLIKRIKSLDLTASPHCDFARNMFMMSFYLRGMSFVDMAFLRKTDLRDGYITYRRRKTGQQLVIEWTPEMQSLLDAYPENKSEYLLPIITTPGVNERCAYHNAAYRINKNLKTVSSLIGSPVAITLYVARHSWASAARDKGIPLNVISEGMGHDSEKTTRIYLASLDKSVVDRANSLILSSLL